MRVPRYEAVYYCCQISISFSLLVSLDSSALYSIIQNLMPKPCNAANVLLTEYIFSCIEIDRILLLRLHLRNSIDVVLMADLRMSTS